MIHMECKVLKAYKTKIALCGRAREAYDMKSRNRSFIYVYGSAMHRHNILSGCEFQSCSGLNQVTTCDLYGVQIKK